MTMCRNVPCWAVMLMVGGIAQGATIANWNFNSLEGQPNTPTVINADFGSGTLFADGSNGSSAWVTSVSGNQLDSFTGTTVNALMGDTAGRDLAFRNGSANGQSIVLAFSMANLTDLQISYAARRSGTGFNSQIWAWSTDGSSFTDFGSFDDSDFSGYTTLSLVAPDALDGAANAYLRLTFDGATSVSGNNRLDNLRLEATIIPLPPAAWAGMATLAGLVGVRRLRRR